MKKVIAVLIAIMLSVTSTSASAASDAVKALGIMVIMGTGAHYLSKALSAPKAGEPQQAAAQQEQPVVSAAPVVQQQAPQAQEVVQSTPISEQLQQQPVYQATMDPPPELNDCTQKAVIDGKWKCFDEPQQVASAEEKIQMVISDERPPVSKLKCRYQFYENRQWRCITKEEADALQ